VRTEVGLYFSVPNDFKVQDFTSLNPLAIAWELVPFSFVVDWFVGVGSYLDSWENHYRFKGAFQGGYRTDSYKEIFTVTRVGRTVTPTTYYANGTYATGNDQFTRSVCSRRQTYKNRVKLTTLPTPASPILKFRMGANQFLDSVALIQQVVVKRFR
jgi:hypothetical protein